MRSDSALLSLKEFSEQAARFAPKVVLALLIILVGVLVTRVIRTGVQVALRRARLRPASVLLAGRVASAFGWVLVGIIVLSTLQLQALVLGISGALALIGAAFVTSAAGISNDIIAGFFLAADQDIGVGYRIRAAGVQGIVRDIDFRKTRIVDDAGNLHVIPNRLVENAEWIVLASTRDFVSGRDGQ